MAFVEPQKRAWLKVCITCDRYAALSSIGPPLADAVEAATVALSSQESLTLLRVPCLSGCRNPGNVALGAFGKTKIRLHRVTMSLAGDIASLAQLYVQSPSGDVPETEWPQSLRGHLAAAVSATCVLSEIQSSE